MKLITALAALSLVVGSLSPAQAQGENTIILDEFRMKLTKPATYTRAVSDETYPIVLYLQSPIDRYSNTQQTSKATLSYKLLGGILLITMPKPKTGLQSEVDNALPSDREVEAFSKVVPGMAIEKKAKIKVAGRDALSVLASLDISQTHGIQEEATLRLIFMVHKNTRMIWLFAGMNADFEATVKDFEKTINSIKFLDDKPAAPTTKTSPAKPTGKKRG